MADKISLSDYMPKPDELDVTAFQNNRLKLAKYLYALWPELDTRPNSVFGDVVLTPMSALMTALDTAHLRRESDLNLANLASGSVFNETFARAYLANFGVGTRSSINTSGVVRLLFSTDKQYALSSDTRITINGANYRFSEDEGDPVIVYPSGSTVGTRVLTRVGNNQFAVFFPVSGSPGGSVSDGTVATTSISNPELLSVVAVGDFDPGVQTETVAELARKASKTFYSATLTTRSGCLGFLEQKFPGMVGASAVVTGDTEMIRDLTSPLGIRTGALDLYVKSRVNYLFGEQIVTLTYDSELQGWVGKLALPQPPAFFDLSRGVFQVGNFNNERSINTVYSKSNSEDVDSVGVAYSNLETLGILVDDKNPKSFENHVIGLVVNKNSNSAILTVDGIYSSTVFGNTVDRAISITFQKTEDVLLSELGVVGEGTTKIAVASAVDARSGETVTVRFAPDNVTLPTCGRPIKNYAYDQLLRGLDLKIESSPSAFAPAQLVGTRFETNYRGRTAEFSVNYLHDPLLVSVDSAVNDSDNKPAGVDVLVKSFCAAHVAEFVVNYRARFGVDVNLTYAREQISNYVNSIIFPNVYEESTVGAIMMAAGASGVQSIVKRCDFYPCLGSKFVQVDGTEIEVPRETSRNMYPSTNDFGLGSRNISFILDKNTIRFNATVF